MKKSTKNRKALLIISDGGDNSSRYTEGEVRSHGEGRRHADLRALGIYEGGGGRDRGSPEESNGPALLGDPSRCKTGGRAFTVDGHLSELSDVAAKIGIELRNRYVLGYSRRQQRDGKYHHVQVKIVPPHGLLRRCGHFGGRVIWRRETKALVG